MSEQELLKRSEVSDDLKWDLSHLYASDEEFFKALEAVPAKVSAFVSEFKGKLDSTEIILDAIQKYEQITVEVSQLYQYAYLPVTVDITDAEAVGKSRKTSSVMAELFAELSFFSAELMTKSEDTLKEVVTLKPEYSAFIRHTLKNKAAALDPKVEEALELLNPVLDGFTGIYDQAISADADFGTFEVDGKEYPLSFVLYEEYYMYHEDPKIRRASYDKFNEVLAQYQNTIANTYYQQVLKEKITATMRGYDSVIDYLLARQEISPELYHRQIDMIMNDFAPVMQKYITHVKEENGLEKMTYADLKIDLDPEYAVPTSIPESREIVRQALSVLGEEYTEMIDRGFDEDWIDFARNIGKSSGAFCYTTYGNHPYIMMSYSGLLSDTYTLIHELGHAGQGLITNKHNPPTSSNMSMYLIEAPSTFHELLLSHYLKGQARDARAKRDVIAKMISKTYFHNFVTHLLEAAYQREVYKLIDNGESFGAEKLNELKRQVLEDFWGDAVELEPGCELTWMRQTHYYMGLYPYTYSAGLTIATQAYLKLVSGEMTPEDWFDFMRAGDRVEPAEAAEIAGVDIKTDQALSDTIQYLDESINEMIALTAEMKNE